MKNYLLYLIAAQYLTLASCTTQQRPIDSPDILQKLGQDIVDLTEANRIPQQLEALKESTVGYGASEIQRTQRFFKQN